MSPKDNKPRKKDKKEPQYRKNGAELTGELPNTDPPPVEEKGNINDKWEKVRKMRRKYPTRPDALIIGATTGQWYADILKHVKSDPRLNVLGENVKAIRKTTNGKLILELNKPEHEHLLQFRDAVSVVLGNNAEVRAAGQETTIEIKDIDEVTTEEEILEALRKFSNKMENLQMSSIKTIRTAYGGTRTATVSLGVPQANILMDAGKIKIGWVVCRIRQKVLPKRCFKCLDFGHIAVNCRNDKDYRNTCIKCEENGHKIKDCLKKPSCLLCKENKGHVTGSSRCPRYRSAMEVRKSRA